MNSNADLHSSWKAIGDLGNPAGFIAPAKIQTNLSNLEFQNISQAATQVLKNPLEVQRLADKVYELMKADLQSQRDRIGNYRGWE